MIVETAITGLVPGAAHAAAAVKLNLRKGGAFHPRRQIPDSVLAAALRVLQRTTAGWEKAASEGGVTLSDFRMETLTGGMTNVVFKCTKPSGFNRAVLLRAYGEGTEMFFSRKDELAAFTQLSERGLGPKLLGEFTDGRVEEFVFGKALAPRDLRDGHVSVSIAAKVAAMHATEVHGVRKEPLVLSLLPRYHRRALELCGERYRGIDVAALGGHVSSLCARLARRNDPIVFCHNDLQYGNVMRVPKEGSAAGDLLLIDFEYSGYNPAAYDIANHFCEWMADYHSVAPHRLNPRKFPSEREQIAFCRAYLAAEEGGEAGVTAAATPAAAPVASVGEASVAALVAAVNDYVPASHLLWACWGLAQSRVSSIDFDYVAYASQRMELFTQTQRSV